MNATHFDDDRARVLAQHWAANRQAAIEALAGCDAEPATERELFDWAFQGEGGPGPDDGEALLAWVRRRMEQVAAEYSARLGTEKRIEILPGVRLSQAFFPADKSTLSYNVMTAIGEPFTSDPYVEYGIARKLCELAGWPSGKVSE